jgi:hypothetical protein
VCVGALGIKKSRINESSKFSGENWDLEVNDSDGIRRNIDEDYLKLVVGN